MAFEQTAPAPTHGAQIPGTPSTSRPSLVRLPTPLSGLAQTSHVINLTSHQIRRRPILDGLTSEYHTAA